MKLSHSTAYAMELLLQMEKSGNFFFLIMISLYFHKLLGFLINVRKFACDLEV